MTAFPRHGQRLTAHRGVALLAGLVILAAISLLALVATASMILQRRMSSNFNDAQQARQAATAAVSQGEAFVLGLDHGERMTGCSTDCFLAPLDAVIRQPTELPAFPETEGQAWWSSWATEIGFDPISGNPVDVPWDYGSEQPRFIIEEIYFEPLADVVPEPAQPIVNGVGYYRILARGTGAGPGAISISEAIVARPWMGAASGDPDTPVNDPFCAAFEPWYDCGRVAWRQRR